MIIKHRYLAAALALATPLPAAADQTAAALLGFGAGMIGNNTTTLGAGAGELETWVIAGQVSEKAADELWKKLDAPKGTSLLLLSTQQTFDPSVYQTVKARTTWLRGQLDDARAGCQALAGVKADEDGKDGVGEFTNAAILKEVLGVLKSERTLSEKTITPPDAFWLNAVAGRKPAGLKLYTPATLIPDAGATVATEWQSLVRETASLAVTSCLESKKPQAEAMKRAVAEIRDANSDFLKAEAGKLNTLEQASALQTLMNQDLWILRTSQQKVAGTIVQSKNIFTAFGAPALRIGGGMMVTWELIRIPKDQPAQVSASGNFSCTAPMRRFGTANTQALDYNSINCPPKLKQPST